MNDIVFQIIQSFIVNHQSFHRSMLAHIENRGDRRILLKGFCDAVLLRSCGASLAMLASLPRVLIMCQMCLVVSGSFTPEYLLEISA